jgi:hypothetical protein
MYKGLFSFLKVLDLRIASNSPFAILFPSTILSLQQFFSLPKASHTKETKSQKPSPSKSPKAKASKQRSQSKSLVSSFRKSFIPSGKQGGAAVLREGHDIVTGETCHSCFSECKQLRSCCSAFPSSMARAVLISAYR